MTMSVVCHVTKNISDFIVTIFTRARAVETNHHYDDGEGEEGIGKSS